MSRYHYDAIIFDFDGTLVQSNEIKTWAFGKLYEKYGEDIVRYVTDFQVENGGFSRFVKFRHFHEHLLGLPYTDEVGKKLSKNYTQLVFDEVVRAPHVEGALEFLKKHYQHISLFVASGTPEPELREIIKHRSIPHFFQGVYGSPATKTEILQRILVKRKLYPEQVLMIGDALTDWKGAQGVGVEFIGIKSGKSSNIFPSSNNLLNNLTELDKYVCQK